MIFCIFCFASIAIWLCFSAQYTQLLWLKFNEAPKVVLSELQDSGGYSRNDVPIFLCLSHLQSTLFRTKIQEHSSISYLVFTVLLASLQNLDFCKHLFLLCLPQHFRFYWSDSSALGEPLLTIDLSLCLFPHQDLSW